jgi:hypothetical protein
MIDDVQIASICDVLSAHTVIHVGDSHQIW